MMWDAQWIGKPSAILRAMAAHRDLLSICAKVDFDHVAPALTTLVALNDEQHFLEVAWRVHTYEASVASNSYSYCQVTIKSLGTVVE